MNAATHEGGSRRQTTTSLDKGRLETRAALKREIESLGHTWQEREHGGMRLVAVDGIDVFLEMPEEGMGTFHSRRGSGRLRLKFGDYGDVQQFPEPKAGFDAPRIAKAISAYVRERVARQQAAEALCRRRDASRALADAINDDLGLSSACGIRAEANLHSGSLQVRIEQSCSENEARALLAVAKQILAERSAQ